MGNVLAVLWKLSGLSLEDLLILQSRHSGTVEVYTYIHTCDQSVREKSHNYRLP